MREWRLRDPFAGASHMVGAGLSAAGLVVLLCLSRGKPWHVSAFSIYGASLIILYTASTLLHSVRTACPRKTERFLIFDQVAIFFLIAGTYTPLCLVTLRGPWGWSLLGVVWGLAIAGAAMRIFWRRAPLWLPQLLYLVMGWLCVVAYHPILRAFSLQALGWLLAGGIIYSVGAVIYATERPRLWPGRFGSHDLWHVFVLAGSGCHYVFMAWFVAPLP